MYKRSLQLILTVKPRKEAMMNAVIKKMAKELAVPEWKIKEGLGIPLKDCGARSVTDAKKAYECAEFMSEEERAAFLSWKSLSFALLDLAHSAKECEEIYFLSPDDSEIKEASLMKWIDCCQSQMEIIEVLSLPLGEGSKFHRAALIKFFMLLVAEESEQVI